MTCHGANLQTEGLETGEFKIDAVAQFDELEPTYTILKVNGQAIPLPVPVEEEETTHQIA